MSDTKYITDFADWKDFMNSEFCPEFLTTRHISDPEAYVEGLYNFLMIEAPTRNLYKLALDRCYPYERIEDIMREYSFETTDEVYDNLVVFLTGCGDRLILLRDPLSDQLEMGCSYEMRYCAKYSHSYR